MFCLVLGVFLVAGACTVVLFNLKYSRSQDQIAIIVVADERNELFLEGILYYLTLKRWGTFNYDIYLIDNGLKGKMKKIIARNSPASYVTNKYTAYRLEVYH